MLLEWADAAQRTPRSADVIFALSPLLSYVGTQKVTLQGSRAHCTEVASQGRFVNLHAAISADTKNFVQHGMRSCRDWRFEHDDCSTLQAWMRMASPCMLFLATGKRIMKRILFIGGVFDRYMR